jgi:acetolactate decarboxylase
MPLKILITVISIALCLSLTLSDGYKVEYKGTLKKIMHEGDISSKIKLEELKDKENLFALGAVENLKGEILIWDSEPFVSYVDNGQLMIDNSFQKNATLLVYTQIQNWMKIDITETIKTYKELENFIENAAAENNINVEEPFPFLLSGEPASVDWHVIDWKKGDTEHSHEKHKKSGMNGTLENIKLEILGFYSKKHHTIFTHHTTNMHLHVKSKDNKIYGHVDDITLNSNMHLFLPKVAAE